MTSSNPSNVGEMKGALKLAIFICSILFLLMVFLPMTGRAVVYQGSLGYHEVRSWYWDAEPGDVLHYDFVIENQVNADVFVMDESDYQDFLDGETFQYYTYASSLDTREGEKNWVIPDRDTYYVVLDNTEAGDAAPQVGESLNFTMNTTLHVTDQGPGSGVTGSDVQSGSIPYFNLHAYLIIIIGSAVVVGIMYKLHQDSWDRYYR